MSTDQLAKEFAAIVERDYGCKLRPVRMHGPAEFDVQACRTNGGRDELGDPCGQFGERFAALLNASRGARTGAAHYGPCVHFIPENGWCYLSVPAARAIVENHK